MTRTRRPPKPILAAVVALLTLGLSAGVASSATLAPGPDRDVDPIVERAPSSEAASRAPRHEPQKARRAATRPAPRSALLAHIPHDLKVTSRPGGGSVVGTMPAGSRFFDEPLRAWVLKTSQGGRFAKVTLPYSGSRAMGWIRIASLKLSRTPYSVQADLSRHSVTVMRKDEVIMRFRAATGAPDSPTPVGRYFVTDLVAIPEGGVFGTHAFGLSGIQTKLPEGWTGGDQLAIHGTNDPGSIGTSASAGCLRVSEPALEKLKRVIQLGTPVSIVR